ncbi:MAG TPA: SH3 domain-containing protein, partial [Lachnospiraceae bacterium]|nr:SH3 domain-containing protein [Lachnospiraceae bacterium]
MGYINEKIKKRFRMSVKMVLGFCCVLMMILVLSMDALAAEGVVQASSANIRSSADPGSTILASVLKGDKLTIKEQATGTDGKTWYKVFIDGNTLGYVRSDLLSTTENVPVSTTTTTTTTPEVTPATNNDSSSLNTNVTVNTEGVSSVQPVSGSVAKDQVRVRADNTTSAGIVTTIKKDVVFTVNGTKTNATNEIWYLVNCVVNGTDVTGYIRSDFVTLTGDLLPVEETPVETTETSEETVPVEEVEVPKDYETRQEDDVWYLVDNVASAKYQISKLITTAQQNATDLISAQKKISKQNVIIVVLTIILVVMALGITLLIFKIKDLMD